MLMVYGGGSDLIQLMVGCIMDGGASGRWVPLPYMQIRYSELREGLRRLLGSGRPKSTKNFTDVVVIFKRNVPLSLD